jgi:hypothetical protein
MELRFVRDRETGLPHIYEHGVTEEEVRQVLAKPGDDFPGTGDSRIALGQTQAGRYLQVVYLPKEAVDDVLVITAYDLTRKAKTAYRRRRRRKRR